MPPPSIAIFGAGLIGRRHIEQAVAQATLCAIVDPTEAARDLAKSLNVPHFETPSACLAACHPDGVVIATPNQMHASHALMCIDADIPVLIEKPLADTLDAADQIVKASEARGAAVLTGHHRRHNPIIKAAHTAIAAGKLGDIRTVNGQFWLYKPDDYFDATWRKGAGAGPAMINMIHDIDLLRHLCGDIADVQAMRSNQSRGGVVEDTAAVMMRFENGALGTFSISDTVVAPWSWEMTSAENPIYPHHLGACYTIGGTLASLSIPDLKLWTHEGSRSWWNPISSQTLPFQPEDAFALQFAHFLDVIAGAPPLVSAREGRESLATVLDVVEHPLEPNPEAHP
ncbi:Gfo/Idh/MocA family oxidoreductase [Octadecabacter sp. CECT 8868]|uniref:Gfo/Idh/MocA family oxidoreductase n=1 Tax=Octadecabacter algicola TaxID=2909342 RepID=UPI00300C73CA|nr:Gfo/Idh/MocA family oxidoreductase [Octadecabacter algicola]